jgi:hypothetical protein
MSKVRLIMLCVFAISAFGAVSATNALATFELTGEECVSGLPALCDLVSEKFTALKGSDTIANTEALGGSLLEVAELGLHIVCAKATATATFEQSEPLTSSFAVKNLGITFTECTVKEKPGCVVSSGATIGTIVVAGTKGTPDDEDGEEAGITFEPEVAGGTFTTIKIKKASETSVCPATITSVVGEVTGSVLCVTPETEKESIKKAIDCLHSSSALLYGKKTATFELLEDYELTSKIEFAQKLA